MTGNKLIHNAATRADKFVFGLLTEKSELCQLQGMARQIQERVACGYFNGCRGTQPRAEGHFSKDGDVCSAQRVARFFQRPRDAQRIVRPLPCCAGLQIVEAGLS